MAEPTGRARRDAARGAAVVQMDLEFSKLTKHKTVLTNENGETFYVNTSRLPGLEEGDKVRISIEKI